MLLYLLRQGTEIQEIQELCNSLNTTKINVRDERYEKASIKDEKCLENIDAVIQIAKCRNDEKLANAAFVFKIYYLLFVNLGLYFSLLKKCEYEKSWNVLQDCFDVLGQFEKHCGTSPYETADIRLILENYERMYPFTHFLSPGFVIGKASCSICGRSMLGLNCKHITGELYWGEQARMVIEELAIKEISIVENPDDRRKILRINGQGYTFEKLEGFLSQGIPFLKLVNIREEVQRDKSGNIIHIQYHITPIQREMKWYYFNVYEKDSVPA